MFNVKTLEETQQIISNIEFPLKTHQTKTIEALGYYISEDIKSTEEVPAFNKSTVDGYACKYDDVKLTSEGSPALLKLMGKVEMGQATKSTLQSGEAYYVPTGGFLPSGTEVMVMIEHTEPLNNEVLIYKKHSKNQNMILRGQDIKINEILVDKNTKVTPRVIGALMSQNVKVINVYNKLIFSVISTGDEIVDQETIKLGQVRDINTHTVSSFIETKGYKTLNKSIIQDDYDRYKNEIVNGFNNSDVVISSGGSSVGEKDYTFRILEDIGANILLHGLNLKPGKPTIIATYKNKIFIGLPGHPMSAYMVLQFILDMVLDTVYKQQSLPKPYIELTLTENVHNHSGRTLAQLVNIDFNSATPLHFKSAMVKVLKDAYGYIIVDQNSEGLYKGETVKVYKLGD